MQASAEAQASFRRVRSPAREVASVEARMQTMTILELLTIAAIPAGFIAFLGSLRAFRSIVLELGRIATAAEEFALRVASLGGTVAALMPKRTRRRSRPLLRHRRR